MQLLKVDEWEGATSWYVGDTKTWTGWRGIGKVLGVDTPERFTEILEGKYNAEVGKYNPEQDYIYFTFKNYKDAHRLKLDVNRIARKQNIQVEKWQRVF